MHETPPSETPTPNHSQLSKRAWVSLCILAVLTLASLAMAWWWPEKTWLHFAWVAQALPVLYVVLMWWGSTDLKESADGD
jgi:hypothetical protein